MTKGTSFAVITSILLMALNAFCLIQAIECRGMGNGDDIRWCADSYSHIEIRQVDSNSDNSYKDLRGISAIPEVELMVLASSDLSIVINEIHPKTGTCATCGNEKVELYNMGDFPVNVNLWHLENITGYVIATIDNEAIAPHGFLVVNVTGLIGDRQKVTLFDTEANEIDSVMYTGAVPQNGLCYARILDGANNWEWIKCTIGSSNYGGLIDPHVPSQFPANALSAEEIYDHCQVYALMQQLNVSDIQSPYSICSRDLEFP